VISPLKGAVNTTPLVLLKSLRVPESSIARIRNCADFVKYI
jgi:hypothetical protein